MSGFRLVNGTRTEELVGDRLVYRQRLLIPFTVSLLGNLIRGLLRLVRWSVRSWSITAPAAGLLLACLGVRRLGLLTLAWLLALTLVAGGTWWWVNAPSVRRTLGRLLVRPWWANWRLTTVYRRRWRAAMVGSGLAVAHGFHEFTPQLRRCRSTRWTDTLTVRLLHGQVPEDYEKAAEGLRHVFGAFRCIARETRPGEVALRFFSRDPLVAVVPALDPDPHVDPARVPVGLTEDGEPYTLPLLGNHVLVAGATGSGKGSVIWSTIRALAPLVAAGMVELWVIDPKGGMEMTFGRALFARYEDTNPDAMARLLEDAADAMDDRTQRLKGITRVHTPVPGDPLVVLIVDEMASLTAYVGDRDVKRRVNLALQLLLTKGRAPGFTVLAALQDPRKDVLPFRDLFPQRIALRLTEPEQADMVLGDSARDRGARCDQIPQNLPGVGYVVTETDPLPVRVRFGYVSDADIRETCRRWAAGPRQAGPEMPGAGDATGTAA